MGHRSDHPTFSPTLLGEAPIRPYREEHIVYPWSCRLDGGERNNRAGSGRRATPVVHSRFRQDNDLAILDHLGRNERHIEVAH